MRRCFLYPSAEVIGRLSRLRLHLYRSQVLRHSGCSESNRKPAHRGEIIRRMQLTIPAVFPESASTTKSHMSSPLATAFNSPHRTRR